MSGIIPIQQNKTACVNKWAWSSIYLNTGTTASCHRCRHYAFDEYTIMNFHNLPGKIADRNKMLQGEWPGNGCEYCRDVEAVGGVSDRIPFGDMSAELIPEQLKTNPSSTVVSPTILEVYFNNTCNQSCVYCRPRFSSQIEYEVRKFGKSKFNIDYGKSDTDEGRNYSIYLNKFFEWMKLHGSKLQYFKMLGGEPLYQDEFNMLLDFFENNPSPNLRWDIFTNLNHDNEKFKIKIQKVKKLIEQKKLKSVHFICSIDCWGPDVEYVRHGFDMSIAENNMNLILETEGVTTEIHATITALSLPSMHLLAQKWASWSRKKRMNFHWNTVVSPSCFDVYYFGNHLVDSIDKFINELISLDDCSSADEYFDKHTYQQTILGIKKRMLNSTPNAEQINNLYGFLDELDSRRNENWKERFPQVASIMQEIIAKNDV